MRQRLRSISRSREDAQAMIFFAVVIATLALTTGLAVEGGRAFVEYRKLQNAADLAAIVGAQKLPCSSGGVACSSATGLACQIAINNGFNSCDGTNTTRDPNSAAAVVPPLSCSPYAALDYGNDNGDGAPYANSACKTGAGVAFYDYIEVKLLDNLGTIPVFNIPITLTAHAVARHGVPSTKDFAVSQLQPGPSGFLSVGGHFHWVVNGSTFANGALSLGGDYSYACEGGDFTATNASTSPPPANGATNPATFSAGVTQFAPPTCLKSDNTPATPDAVAVWGNNLPPVSDPYCTSVSPPYNLNGAPVVGTNCKGASFGIASMPNCPDCSQNGWYFDGTNWHGGGTGAPPDVNGGGANVELFPGVYGNISMSAGDSFHMNPGVYTITGTMSFDFGAACVFGAPACDSGKAAGQCQYNGLTFLPGSAASNTFYYNCSSYGFWDTKLPRPASAAGGAASVPCPAGNAPIGAGSGISFSEIAPSHNVFAPPRGKATPTDTPVPTATPTAGPSPTPQPTSVGTAFGPSCTPPTFWDTSSTNNLGINGGAGGVGTLPLNGVTLNFTSTASLVGHGAGNSNLAWFITAPNPCPGTGSTFLKTTDPNGPQVSFNLGEAAAYYTYDASSSDQLVVARFGAASVSPIISGFGSQIYPSMDLTIAGECMPNTQEVWPGEMGGRGQHLHFVIFDRFNNFNKLNGNEGQSFTGIWYLPNATLDVRGAGKGLGGVPFITGQIIAWDINFGGNGAVDLIYRPCNTTADPCASGLGTQLIQ